MREAPVGFHCPDDAALGRKSIPRQRNAVGAWLRHSPPYVTGALIALNVAVYLYTGFQSAGGLGNPVASKLFYDWQLFPYAVYHQDQYYRLITGAFLHVSPLHIGANMLALFFVGVPLERLLGPLRFTAVYLLGLVGGAAAIFAFGSPEQPVVGASGAIFGLFAACLMMVRQLGLDRQWLIAIIVLNFAFTFSVADVSKLAHIGGFVAGGLAASAIGGMPRRVRHRLPGRVQAAGLTGVFALSVLVIALRFASGAGSF